LSGLFSKTDDAIKSGRQDCQHESENGRTALDEQDARLDRPRAIYSGNDDAHKKEELRLEGEGGIALRSASLKRMRNHDCLKAHKAPNVL
jgi:hypothetical protein